MRDSNERLRTEVAQMVDDVHGLISRLVAAKAVHDAVTATATVERGQITVVTDASGAVREVEFGDYIDELNYHRIARGVVRAAQRAADEVRGKADDVLAPQRSVRAQLPTLSDLVDRLPGAPERELPPPPPALRTPPSEREPLGHPADDTLADRQQRRAELYATATAEGRRVTASVNADGVLIDIQFSGAIGDLDYDEIAAAITDAARVAVASVARKVAELYAPTVADDRPAFPGPDILLAGLERLRDQLR
ncbi:YbaB/EbfC family nucleoid-associated protein [Nocardia arizonensis]|uniref:YbaB/EbfC family nucleoid-associated protein n=1 Tax=Nocardia arizonensis TaxID=1141647 RepID=UPI0006D1F479|nr:YbaB/EbfC family nucleoid-associated protein [Nocardia arizonensis]